MERGSPSGFLSLSLSRSPPRRSLLLQSPAEETHQGTAERLPSKLCDQAAAAARRWWQVGKVRLLGRAVRQAMKRQRQEGKGARNGREGEEGRARGSSWRSSFCLYGGASPGCAWRWASLSKCVWAPFCSGGSRLARCRRGTCLISIPPSRALLSSFPPPSHSATRPSRLV